MTTSFVSVEKEDDSHFWLYIETFKVKHYNEVFSFRQIEKNNFIAIRIEKYEYDMLIENGITNLDGE